MLLFEHGFWYFGVVIFQVSIVFPLTTLIGSKWFLDLYPAAICIARPSYAGWSMKSAAGPRSTRSDDSALNAARHADLVLIPTRTNMPSKRKSCGSGATSRLRKRHRIG